MTFSPDQHTRWHCQADVDRLLDTMAEGIAALAHTAIQQRGKFSLVLAGGKTPEALYRKLVFLDTDWSCWHLYFGDERCLPAGHGDRNDTMAKKAWLDHVPVAADHIHCIHAERFEQGAVEYASVIAEAGMFDLVLLGLGEDGHTASLFPGDPTGQQADSAAVVFIANAPTTPSRRISLSVNSLGNSRALWLLVMGENKKIALENFRNRRYGPAALITATGGVDIFTNLRLD